MKFSKELKVGFTIVLALILFIFGVRYMQDIPIFSGTFELYSNFPDAGGLLTGNPVRVNGVDVGKVESVRLDPVTRLVQVRYHVDTELCVPRGSYAVIDGIAALQNLYLRLEIQGAETDCVEEGSLIPGQEEKGLSSLLGEAPAYVQRADSILLSTQQALTGANRVFEGADVLINGANVDLRQTLGQFRETAASLDRVIRGQEQRLGAVMANIDTITADVSRFSRKGSIDSVAVAIENLNRLLRRLETDTQALGRSVGVVDSLVAGIGEGRGNLGMLLSDSTLYGRIDTSLSNINAILEDFKRNPGKYLRHVDIIDVF